MYQLLLTKETKLITDIKIYELTPSNRLLSHTLFILILNHHFIYIFMFMLHTINAVAFRKRFMATNT